MVSYDPIMKILDTFPSRQHLVEPNRSGVPAAANCSHILLGPSQQVGGSRMQKDWNEGVRWSAP